MDENATPANVGSMEWLGVSALMAACLLLAACDEPVPKMRGEARAAMFKECMVLAAKIERKADDDVADIVTACANQSYYLTIYIK